LALKNENGEVFGILTMYADEIRMLEEMADNLLEQHKQLPTIFTAAPGKG